MPTPKTNAQRMIVLVVVALIVHVAMVAESNRHVPFRIPLVDAASYHWQAVGIIEHTTAARAFWQPPLYPYWLALTYACVSTDVGLARYANGAFFVMTVLLTFLIGLRVMRGALAFLAALAVCGYGPLLFFSGLLLPNVMATALDMLVILLLLRFVEAPTRGRAMACGAAIGLAVLAVPNVAILLPVIGLWLLKRAFAMRQWRGPAMLAVWLGLGVVLSVAPVTVHNRIVSGDWVLVSTHGGINFYIGNNPQADTTQAIRPGDEWGQLVVQPYRDGARSDPEAERYFYRKAADYLVARPLGFLNNTALKCVRFWNAREIPRNTAVEYFCSLSPLLHPLVWRLPWFSFPFGLLGPLGIFGMLVALRRDAARQWVALFVVVYALSVILYFPAARYRLPIIPPLAIFAVLGLETLVEAARRDWRRACGFAGLLLGLVVLVNWPVSAPTDRLRLDAELHTDVGIGLQVRGDPDRALMEYQAALERDPENSEALYYQGTALRALRKTDRAINSYQRCLEVRPEHPRAMHDLALLLFERKGSELQACRMMSKALALDPENRQTMTNLGIMLNRCGKKEAAEYWLNKAGVTPTASVGN